MRKGRLLNLLWLSSPLETQVAIEQSLKVEQYVRFCKWFCIFPVFLSKLRKGLPKCKVAHSIRRSYLYKADEDHNVQSEVSKKYPLPYYYIQKEHIASFYYNKNNLIAYYTNSSQNNVLRIVPLYDHVKNDYEIILSDYEYNFKRHHDACIFKAPNRHVYLLHEESDSITIVNIGTGKLLYDSRNYFSDSVFYLFRSMPIANSFIVAMMSIGNEIVIHVIDSITEKIYEQRCSIEKIKESILSLSKNDRYYEEIKNIEYLDKFYIDINVNSSIDTSIANSVFYDKYVVNISLYLGASITTHVLEVAISLIAIYRDNELAVTFQINRKVTLVTSSYTYEIDFGETTILTSGKYKLDSKYDTSQSRLYSVIISAGDYTIIKESNRHWSGFALYCNNEIYAISPYGYFILNSFDNILFVRASDKRLACVNKNRLIKMNIVNRYYVECIENDNSDDSTICRDINVIEAKVVRDLLLNRMPESNDVKWVAVDITDKVKNVHLKDKLEKEVKIYTCSNEDFIFFDYAFYIDYDTEEFYSLVFSRCKSTNPKKYRVYLFKCKIDRLLSSHNPFILVWKFETSVLKSKVSSILHNFNKMTSSGNRVLRMLSKKFGKEIRLIGLKIFESYDKSNAYHDYGYNRKSIRTLTQDTSIVSTLHLVRRMLPTF